MLLHGESKLTCKFSDALAFYTSTAFIKTIGITDLESHFNNKSIQIRSSYQVDLRMRQGVFILAHLLEFVDPSYAETKVYHPENIITINGYFMDNSESGQVVFRIHIDDQSEVTEVCNVTPLQISCKVKKSHKLFGEVFISLEEVGSGIHLSDESFLNCLVLPLPTINSMQV